MFAETSVRAWVQVFIPTFFCSFLILNDHIMTLLELNYHPYLAWVYRTTYVKRQNERDEGKMRNKRSFRRRYYLSVCARSFSTKEKRNIWINVDNLFPHYEMRNEKRIGSVLMKIIIKTSNHCVQFIWHRIFRKIWSLITQIELNRRI